MATLLHPTLKSLQWLANYNTSVVVQKVADLVWSVFQDQFEAVPIQLSAPKPQPTIAKKSGSAAVKAILPPNSNPPTSQAESELNLWRSFKFNLDPDGDLLGFWKTHEPQFPRVAQLAKQFLITPPSSASAERVWSLVRRVLTFDRTSLSATSISALMSIKQAMLQERLDTQETRADAEPHWNTVSSDADE